jgi:hypothetical protein
MLFVIRSVDDLRSAIADANEYLAIQRGESAAIRRRIASSVFGYGRMSTSVCPV